MTVATRLFGSGSRCPAAGRRRRIGDVRSIAISGFVLLILLSWVGVLSIEAAPAATRTNEAHLVPVFARNSPVAGLWSLANDFSSAPDKNPAPDAFGHPGVWSFLASNASKHEPSTYSKLGRFTRDQFRIAGLDSWGGNTNPSADPNDYLPQVSVNVSGTTKDHHGIDWPDHAVLAHPLPDSMAVIGWKSPITGTVTSAGTLTLAQQPSCGNGIAWSLDLGSKTLASGIAAGSAPASFQHTIAIRTSDQLYLTIDAYQHNYYCDSTLIKWTIRSHGT